MPIYNMMFDSIKNWNLFEDGEKITHDLESNSENEANNELENSSKTSDKSESDRRSSDMPQSQIDNVRDGKYLSNYNYDTDSSSREDSSNAKGKSTSKDKNIIHEVTTKNITDKISAYKELQQNVNSIYSMIFKDLESLFYQLV